jgi:transcriptional regulator GlxA family with amidase domain
MDYTDLVQRALDADRSALARVRRLAGWILEDPARVRGVDDLAERAAMSRRNLIRVFRRATGMAPARYVEHARVALARQLLAATGLPVKAIAARCGFRNEERMRRAFQRAFGASPRRYAGCPVPTRPPKRYGVAVRFTGSYW